MPLFRWREDDTAIGQSIDDARSRAAAAIGSAERAFEPADEIASFTEEPGRIGRRTTRRACLA